MQNSSTQSYKYDLKIIELVLSDALEAGNSGLQEQKEELLQQVIERLQQLERKVSAEQLGCLKQVA